MMRSIAILILPALAAGATLHSDRQNEGLMRRQSEVGLTSGGEMMYAIAGSSPMKKRAASGADLCDYNYVPGAAGGSNCTNAATQKLIESDSMCEEAAKLDAANGGTVGSPFLITAEGADGQNGGFNAHPQRCFKTTDGKWFFNPSGYWPEVTVTTDIPICVEVEYINGTEDASECGQDEYENILDEAECRTAATCLSLCIHDNFRVLNATTQQGFPPGCHIHTDGCAEFNNITGTPSGPFTGKALCKMKGTHASTGANDISGTHEVIANE